MANNKWKTASAALGAVMGALLLSACSAPGPEHRAPEPDRRLAALEIDRMDILSQIDPLDGDDWLTNEPYHSIWSRVSQNFVLDYDATHPEIQKYVRRYSRYPNHVQQVTYRAAPYMHYIVTEVEKRGMPLEIALLPMVESAFDPFAHSNAGAAGIWQIMSSTGERFGLQQDWWYDGRRDIMASTTAALDYLEYLNRIFHGDWLLSLAAYNSGEGTVKRAVHRNNTKRLGTHFFDLQLPAQTREYVPKLLALATVIRHAENFNIDLPHVANDPYLETVTLDAQIDLAYAAELANIELKHLYQLNPGFNRWATHPNGPQSLLLPKDAAESFTTKLATMDTDAWLQWHRYQVKPGDTLGGIALDYRTTIDELRRINNLSNHQIVAGHYLLIPANADALDETRLARHYRTANTERWASNESIVHVVRQGDSLWSISRKYKVTIQHIVSWNNLSPKSVLRPGQKLKINKINLS